MATIDFNHMNAVDDNIQVSFYLEILEREICNRFAFEMKMENITFFF